MLFDSWSPVVAVPATRAIAEELPEAVSAAVIDFITACIVLSSPKGESQRLIGFLAGGMVFVHAGVHWLVYWRS